MNKMILSIETSTDICSVSLFKNTRLLSIKENNNREHSSLLALFVEDIFNEVNCKINEIDAVALSIGPGSYTGLRIGLSFTKGLAFSIGKPIIPVDTIESLSDEINDLNYMVAIHAYSDYYFIQEYKNSIKFNKPFFDKIININYTNNIYGYNLKDCKSSIDIFPSSIKIANIAYKNYNEYKTDNIKLVKPNYIKPIQFKNKF
ncbi:MAG: tRNA (adenosine(37)-N6)-threonylcarbamoyltransferase complex dimerization subunit type 1 TsaB [Candidatus Marinimicrobia bacterium]|nr:tRNA (adenosine(37)-N6)-threonylcarbamoyltransferase complex dimerization subunit type 1 TsaB [Candidatus Neomarinimicrobiota bacterium]